MSPKNVSIEQQKGICTLTLNRPEKKNSLSLDMVDLLGDTLKDLAENDDLKVVILRGAGNIAFCSGFDIGLRKTPRRQ